MSTTNLENIERRKEEFWCDKSGGGCGKYFDTYLRSNMNGSYTIQCPNCNHHHFRKIENGLVTGVRDYIAQNQKQILVGLSVTLRDTPWHDDPRYRRSRMRRIK